MFEAFGFHYIGPLNGHDLNELVHVFNQINELEVSDSPILVHVMTKKGYGYKPAEENPEKFHGVGPFDKETGKTISSNGRVSYTQVAGSTILELARQDSNIIGITAAMPTGTGLDIISRELPNQFYDVGIAEGHAVTFAAGLAVEGFRPVVAVYSTFLQRAFDHVLHDICLQNLPVTLAIDRAGLVGEDGPTHHGTFDLSYLRQMPNLIVMAPRDENLLQHMMFTSIYSDMPCAIRYPRGNAVGVAIDKEFKKIPIGEAEVMFGGEDAGVLIAAVGNRVWPAIEAARVLNKEGINTCVVDMRFIKPLDNEILSKMSKGIKKWLTVEENIVSGGFGSAISEWLVKNNCTDIKLKILGLPDKFVEHGGQELLRARYGIDTDGIIKAVKDLWTYEEKSAELEEDSKKKDSLRRPAATSVLK